MHQLGRVWGAGWYSPVSQPRKLAGNCRRDLRNVSQLERLADTYEEFIREVNEPWWQEAFLLSELVYRLHEAGKIPGPGQCYALAPHPALGGRNPASGEAVDLDFVLVTDISVWQFICAQSLV